MHTHYLLTILITAALVQAANLWWFHGDLKTRWDGWRSRAAANIASWFQ